MGGYWLFVIREWFERKFKAHRCKESEVIGHGIEGETGIRPKEYWSIGVMEYWNKQEVSSMRFNRIHRRILIALF